MRLGEEKAQEDHPPCPTRQLHLLPQGVPAPEARVSDPVTSAQARVFVCLSHLSVWVLGPCKPEGGCPGRAVLPRAVPALPRGLSAAVWGEHRELGALSTPP